jgi:protein-disulfide isomerase
VTAMRMLAALALIACVPAGLADARPAARRAAVDWTSVAVATPDGGIRIGNPAAKVQLVEYGSFTCPHCAAFAKEAFPAIRDRYVRTGKVSFEFRAALRDGGDLVAAIVTRCAGPPRFLGTAIAVFDAQADWEQRTIDYGQKLPRLDPTTPPETLLDGLAQASGLAALAAKRGVTQPQLTRCIGDGALRDTLTKAANDAWNVRQIGATPTFYLNGDKLDGVFGWASLEPNLIAALKS